MWALLLTLQQQHAEVSGLAAKLMGGEGASQPLTLPQKLAEVSFKAVLEWRELLNF